MSEEWTFEYCLIRSGLSAEIYEAIVGSQNGFDALPEDAEERAIKLYGMIENRSGAKTDVAYKLSSILQREFRVKGKRELLKSRLPSYILAALEHVTGPWPDDLDGESEPPHVQPVAVPTEQAAEASSAFEVQGD